MNNLDEVAPEDEARTYRQKSYPKRLLGGRRRVDDALPPRVRAVRDRARRASGVPGGSDRRPTPDRAPAWSVDAVLRRQRRRARPASQRGRPHRRASTAQPVTRFDELSRRARPRRVGEDVQLTSSRDGDGRTSTVDARLRPRPRTRAARPGRGSSGSAPIEALLRRARRPRDRRRAGAGRVRCGSPVRPSAAWRRFFSPAGIDDFADQVVNAGDGQHAAAEPAGSGGSGVGARPPTDDEPRSSRSIGVVRLGVAACRATGCASSCCSFVADQHLHRRVQPGPAAAARRRPRRHRRPTSGIRSTSPGAALLRRRRQAAAAHLRRGPACSSCSACRRSTSTSSTRSAE